jgi:aspartate 1-decarboxylase
MLRFMLKSKIHRARLTGMELDYEGSITIDRTLMDAADLLLGEQVHVLNLNNGSRIITYVIEAPANSGTVLLNGPAARTGQVGDQVIVLSYCELPDAEARALRPRVVLVDEENRLQPDSR